MIPEKLYPDLAQEAEDRTTAHAMVLQVSGTLKRLPDYTLGTMVFYLARLVDGVFLDYQVARNAYYRYYRDPSLGGDLSFSAAIVPLLHHIENCVSNMERVREVVVAIRNRPSAAASGLKIEKNDWRIAESNEPAISGLRNAIQHAHDDLKNGVLVQPGISHNEDGTVSLGAERLSLGGLASALRAYRRIAAAAVSALRQTTA